VIRAHGQTGQVSDLVAASSSGRDRQRVDGGWLIYHDQQLTVGDELVEQLPQLGLAVGQRPS
jgi:hypothetical protein